MQRTGENVTMRGLTPGMITELAIDFFDHHRDIAFLIDK
jgi:hypothetical protein